jgi:hypothetical protein
MWSLVCVRQNKEKKKMIMMMTRQRGGGRTFKTCKDKGATTNDEAMFEITAVRTDHNKRKQRRQQRQKVDNRLKHTTAASSRT